MNAVAWLAATRPRTLVASVVPVAVGTVWAWRETGQIAWDIMVLCLGFAFCMQIGANFANDYYDFRRGADGTDRIGPVRAVASGAIKPRVMKLWAGAVLVLGFIFGLVLMWLSNGGLVLLVVGVASVVCAWAYTAGPWPLAYLGAGDFFVILFFGLIAVPVTHFVQLSAGGAAWEQVPWLPALGVGFVINNLLVVNNHRDADTDRRAGKRTLVVRLGRGFGVATYLLAVVLATLIFPLLEDGLRAALFLLPAGLFFTHRLAKTREPRDYAFVFAGTALMVLLYGVACVASVLRLS